MRDQFRLMYFCVWLYTDLLQALKGERLSSVFSLDGTLISEAAAPYCGGSTEENKNDCKEIKERLESTGPDNSKRYTYYINFGSDLDGYGGRVGLGGVGSGEWNVRFVVCACFLFSSRKQTLI